MHDTAPDALRVAFITNLAPYYRVPLFKRLAELLDITFFFFSEGTESYVGSAVRHAPAGLPVKAVRRISVAGHPLLIGLERELDRQRYDVVIKCINGRLMVPYTYALAARSKVPFVLWTGIWSHPRTSFHRFTRPLTERVYRGSDAIVAYGEHVKSFLTSVPGVDPAKVCVSGQAADVQAFRDLEPNLEAQPPTVAFVGRLEAAKGLQYLLDAMTLLDSDVRLRIVGDGPLAGLIRERASTDPRIQLVGPVDHEAVPSELADARCLVLPSITTKTFREPWGLVVNEAMAAGIPVVVTDAVGAAAGGLVVDGDNGRVVPERDSRALANALGQLLADPGRARALGQRGRAIVSTHSYERMSRAFLAAAEYAVATEHDLP